MMDKSLRRAAGIGLVAFLLMLAGCAGQPGTGEALRGGPEPEALLDQAQDQSGTQAALTRLQAADILARRGDAAQALEVASNIEAGQLPMAERVSWALLLSRLGLELEDGWAVIQATELLAGSPDISPGDAQTLRHRRGLGLGLVGEPQAAAETLIDLQRDDAPYDLNDEIWRQLSRLRGQALGQMARDEDMLATGWVALVELQRRHGSDIARLFDRIGEWRRHYPDHPAARRLPDDLRALRDLRDQAVRHMAIFLPESGPLANVAEAIREGLQIRHKHALEEGNQTPRLSFYDSAPGGLDALYAQATLAGAQVVIGPLDKSKVSQLEQRQSVPLPTLALNYGTGPSNSADDLFQYGLSAEDEARQVARRAWLDGHRRAGMLVPDNDWGARVSGAFRQAWQEQGGSLAKAIHYAPEASVASAVRPLLDVRGKRAHQDMDMLFLLALPDYARQVPPTLDFYYASDLPIYATSHLYSGRPRPRADHDLNDVLFVEIPWLIPDAASGGEEALPFIASYRVLHSDDEPALFKLKAMGVDAYELGRRLPLLRSLPSSEIHGATGTLSAGPDRRIRRDLPWAQFRNGVPQPPLHDAARTATPGPGSPRAQTDGPR